MLYNQIKEEWNLKKILSVMLSLFMGISMIVPAMAETYAPGTYTAAANGNNGPVTVETDFDENTITAVRVTKHAETAGICETPIERIPAAIVEEQSLAVDTVAGATNTSRAILLAVADCVAQAGGDPEAMTSAAPAETPATEHEDMDTDVVVVGGGIAGLTAALTAAQAGADVILVEKQAVVGGSGLLTAAGFYGAETSVVPAEVETVDEMYNHILEMIAEGGSLENVDTDRIRHLCESSPDIVKWLEGMGYEFTTTDFGIKDAKPHYHILADGSNGPGQVKILSENVEKAGVHVMTETKCIALKQKNGKMTGITVEQGSAVFDIRAQSVVLACGGFANNQEMMMRLAPQSLFSYTCANVGSTGEVLQMAADLGAAWYNDQFMLTCGFTSDPNSALGMVCYPPYASMPVVDQTGNRFMNEFLLWTLNSEMVRNVENAPFYGIFDSSFLKGTDAEFKYDSMEQAIDAGSPYVVKADTLEELAVKMGIQDIPAFLNTIAAYNSVKGTDEPEPAFGVPNEQLSFVEDGPFYGVLMVSLNAGTMGGIQTKMSGEVLDCNGKEMAGLYACGEASNGAIYDRGYISGTSVLNCYVAGRDAGLSAAAYVK